MRPDADLQKLVMQSLASDPSVDETAIGVSVRHGIVTLSGFVTSYADVHAAEAIVHRVPGVLDVANELDVEGTETNPTDPQIAEAARSALAANPMVPHERLQTTVSGHGHLTLTGSVSTPRERGAAEAAVRHLRGVGLVTNLIVVDTPATSPIELRRLIESALECHLSRAVARIDVEVHGETVVLAGTVESPAERRAVVGAVQGAPGIKHVEDRLQIMTPSIAGDAAT